MDSYREKAETLSRQFGISQADAMKALEECDGDIIDTVSILECQGIIKRTSATFNTQRKSDPSANSFQGEARQVNYTPGSEADHGFSDIRGKISGLLKKSIEYKLAVFKGEKNIIELPLLIVIVLALVVFWLTAILLAAGLLAGCRYEISADQ
ncbi:MAG: DUF4342 domain-containing protein [Oscillospiraceae bacterium]